MSVEKWIHSLHQSYADWEKLQNMALPDAAMSHEAVWQQLLATRKAFATTTFTVGTSTLDITVTPTMQQQLRSMDIYIAGAYLFEQHTTEKQRQRMAINTLVDEAIYSLQLSGINIQKKIAGEFLLKNKTAQTDAEQALRNSYQAYKAVFDAHQEPLSVSLIQSLHAALTKNILLPKAVGKLRTNNKPAASYLYKIKSKDLLPASQVAPVLQQLCDFMNDEWHYVHPVIKAIVLHYIMMVVRPFRDANARLARLLVYYYLLQQGYGLLNFMSLSKPLKLLEQQYKKSLAQVAANHQDMGYFLHFYLQSMMMALKTLRDATVKKEKAAIQPLVAALNERQNTVLQWLRADTGKVITIRELRTVFGVSKECARLDLTALQQQGWLQQYALNKKTYGFIKSNEFDTLLQNQ